MSKIRIWAIAGLAAFSAAAVLAQDKSERSTATGLERRVQRLEQSLERLERAVARP